MKKLLLLLLWPMIAFPQANIFSVETIETGLPFNENGYYKLEHYTPFFYEDDDYIVTSECHGEFGGKVRFKNKKDNTVTVAYAACPVIINKIGSKYLLTTSLAHMMGFYSFFEIDDPRELTVEIQDSTYHSESELSSGMKLLTSGMGKTILLSFPYKSQIYHVVSDHENKECYIALRENATLKKIQQLSKLQMQAFSIDACVTKDGHYATLFSIRENNRLRGGYIDVFENAIKIYLCK